MLAFLSVQFGAFSAFSGQPFFNDFILQFYSLVFTSVPVLVVGVFDQVPLVVVAFFFGFSELGLQVFPRETLENTPSIYAFLLRGRTPCGLSLSCGWVW